MGRSPGFGSIERDYISPYSDLVSLRLRTSWYLTLPLPITRRTVLQKVRGCTSYGASTACKHRVSGSFSLPSRGSFHLSLTVLCAIGHLVIFSLGGWSPQLPARFLVSCGTLVPALISIVRLRGFYPLWRNFPVLFYLNLRDKCRSTTPRSKLLGLGSFPFARRY